MLSAVVPCYNEELVLDALLKRLIPVLETCGDSYEVVLVDDGSRDRTWECMLALQMQLPTLRCVKLSRNFGHQQALSAGLDLARGDFVLVLDADLQDPPELLPRMLELAREGYDVVYGQRQERLGETAFKRQSASAFYRLMNRLVERPIPEDSGDFRLLSRRALEALKALPEYHRFLRGMVSWIGFRQVALPYRREARHAGQTKYPLRKMLAFATDAVTSFSVVPLRIASWVGVMTAGVGGLLLLYSLYSWYYLNAVPGWASVICAVSLLSSVQLLVLGVIGEYLGRLYEQSKHRPIYFIEELRESIETAA